MTSPGTPSGLPGHLGRIDPARSACVLIGVDAYTELEPLRSVRRNLTALEAVLADEEILGIPENRITSVPNPRSAAELVGSIREAAELATDTLIVYYAGHGLLDWEDEEHLYLTLPDSVMDEPETSVPDSYIRRAIRDSTAERRVLLLDCCYSGRFLQGEMSAADAADQGARASGKALEGMTGAYVMTSSSGTRKSLAPDPKRCTVFTEELVGVLREGVPKGPEMLTLHGVFEAVRERMARRKLPQQQEPRVRDDGGLGTLPFVRNLAVAPPSQAPEPAPPASPYSRRRLWLVTAGALALGVIAGVTVVPRVVDWWQERNPRPAGGVCSARAKLLSYSDALDKEQVSGEKVEGLSALALTGPADAWALTDNHPGRIFPLRLGEATKLEPQVQRAKTLRTPSSGTAPSQWFDGEGLVVERSGKRDKTVLVASETGPAIRRFSMTTGKQVGKDLPIPPQFRARPKGDAQAGRTLESLAASADGRYLYAAMEGPLATDGDARGRNLLRIQRYRGTPGGAYELDRQYAYKTGEGMYVAELATAGDDRLLALERQYVAGIGNTIRIYDVPLQGAASVDENTALYDQPSDVFLQSRLLVDLADCPAGDAGVVPTKNKQLNPLLQNVEGMALGEPWATGPDKGRRPLYLISDDNGSSEQITRVYALSVRLDR